MAPRIGSGRVASYLRHGHHIRPGAAHSSRSRHPGSTEMHHGEGAAPLLQHGRHSLTGSRGTSVTTTTQTPATTDTRTRAHNTHGVPARCNGVTPLPSSIVAFLLFSAMSSCSVSMSPNSAAAHTFRAPAATDGACPIVPAPSAAIPHWRASIWRCARSNHNLGNACLGERKQQYCARIPNRNRKVLGARGNMLLNRRRCDTKPVKPMVVISKCGHFGFRPSMSVAGASCFLETTTAASEPAQATRQGGLVVVQCQRKAPSSR